MAGVIFRIVNQARNDYDDYKPFPLKKATLKFQELVIGNTITDLEQEDFPYVEVAIGPNPSKGPIQFKHMLSNVMLMDLMGNVVQRSPSTKSLELVDLPGGMYLLNASELRHPVKILKE